MAATNPAAQAVLRRMLASGVLPVWRTDDARHLVAASQAYYDAGVRCIEVTLTTPDALRLVRELRRALPDDAAVGVGTVLDAAMAEEAARAGAAFAASPAVCEPMLRACAELGLVSVAGAMTPGEILAADRAGADVIKVFPAGSVGPSFFADVRGPFPHLRLMAAAGVSLDDIPAFVAAGADVVTLPAQALDASAYERGDVAAIARAAIAWVDAVRDARQRVARATRVGAR